MTTGGAADELERGSAVGAAIVAIAREEELLGQRALELTDPRYWYSLEWHGHHPPCAGAWPRSPACRLHPR